MKAGTFILLLICLAFAFSCAKRPSEQEFCGTDPNNTWMQTLTKDSLAGTWIIDNIDFKKGTGSTTIFDTSYNPNAKLLLNKDGSGTLNSSPINWSLTIQVNRMPVLALTKMTTIFPFPLKLLHTDTLVTNIQLAPQTRFYVTSQQNEKEQWEETIMSFGR